VVTSIYLFLLDGCISMWISDCIKAGFIDFKKSVLVRYKSVVGIVQTGQ
jgi:hypothetical protein